jgi:lipopolysaccharide/colanic/teichoic acid biosynthesis glycosyltransferase
MSEKLSGEPWITGHRKRAYDIAVSAVTLPAVIPICAVSSFAFTAETGINPFFYQQRLGKNNEIIRILKLRTMPFASDLKNISNGHDDARASRIGKLLRKTTIDEAPQAFHILFGQMSVVGPRPLVACDVEKTMDLLSSKEQVEWQRARSIPRPGWFSEFGNLSRSIEPQSETYLLTRFEEDCKYLADASYAEDNRIIRNALAVGSTVAKELHG